MVAELLFEISGMLRSRVGPNRLVGGMEPNGDVGEAS